MKVHGLLVNCWSGLDHLLFQLPNLQCKCVNQLEEDRMRGFDWWGNIRRSRRGGRTAVNETDSIAQTPIRRKKLRLEDWTDGLHWSCLKQRAGKRLVTVPVCGHHFLRAGNVEGEHCQKWPTSTPTVRGSIFPGHPVEKHMELFSQCAKLKVQFPQSTPQLHVNIWLNLPLSQADRGCHNSISMTVHAITTVLDCVFALYLVLAHNYLWIQTVMTQMWNVFHNLIPASLTLTWSFFRIKGETHGWNRHNLSPIFQGSLVQF